MPHYQQCALSRASFSNMNLLCFTTGNLTGLFTPEAFRSYSDLNIFTIPLQSITLLSNSSLQPHSQNAQLMVYGIFSILTIILYCGPFFSKILKCIPIALVFFLPLTMKFLTMQWLVRIYSLHQQGLFFNKTYNLTGVGSSQKGNFQEDLPM